MVKSEIGVVGLGKFGFCLAEKLTELGHKVIGLDRSETKVRAARDVLSQVYQADGSDKIVLQQLGLGDLPYVIVSIGQSMEASILITMNLKELGARNVWVKAMSQDHEKVLMKLGADFVVFPERYVAEQLARRLAVPGLTNYLPLADGVSLQEVTVDNWSGYTLRQLDLTNKFNLQVVGIKPTGQDQFIFISLADKLLHKGDLLLTIGDEDSFLKTTP